MNFFSERDARIVLRLESIQKNKTLSGLARRNGENYQDIFTSVYNAILGEYFITKFNKIYNPAPDSNQPLKTKKECVLDYLDIKSLDHYLDCVQEVIEDILSNGCTIKQALRKVTPKAKILFSGLSVNDLGSSIEKDVKQRQRQLKKGMLKSTKVSKSMQIPQDAKDITLAPEQVPEKTEYSWKNPSAEQIESWKEEFKRTQEYNDYMFEERDRD